MSSVQATRGTKWKVGIFTFGVLLLLATMTIYVNDRPYWWRPCDLVHISVEDATGLKTKSPVKSLGLQIGYLQSVELSETFVRLGICITAPIEVLPTTRAYIRADGFLGDRFVELKPVKTVKGDASPRLPSSVPVETTSDGKTSAVSPPPLAVGWLKFILSAWDWGVASAKAEDEVSARSTSSGREIPVGEKGQDVEKLVKQVDGLVVEMTSLANTIKDAIRPEDLKQAVVQLNKTLENASKTLAPEGSLNTTAQRTLAKLEDAIEQMRDQLARVNRGEGSVGMILNDPSFANEFMDALKNVNTLLGRVKQIEIVVEVSGEYLPAYSGSRGQAFLNIYPASDRYYLIGAAIDPRGSRTVIQEIIEEDGRVIRDRTTTEIEETKVVFSIMLGKVFLHRIDLSAGILNGNGTISGMAHLGPTTRERMFSLRNDLFSGGSGIDYRLTLLAQPWYGTNHLLNSVVARMGIDSVRGGPGGFSWHVGAGLRFTDEDVRLLFAFQ